MTHRLALRATEPGDEAFLRDVYASTRVEELALVDWTEPQKAAFVDMQFRAQHDYYRERFPDAAYNVILCDGRPAGRLYVDRSPEEIRIVDIALLPAHCRHGIGATLVGDLQREAARSRKPLRIHVERFNPALRLYRAARLPPARGPRGLPVPRMEIGRRGAGRQLKIAS